MPYQDLKKRLDSGDVVILDGATGTELQRRGVDMDPAAWCGVASLDNQSLLTEIHSDYIAAGAEVITANTFASSRVVLRQAGYGDKVGEINRAAVEAALRARDQAGERGVVVAGSLSHTVYLSSAKVPPSAEMPTDDEAAEAFAELAEILKMAGVDLILLEMMYHPTRTPLAVKAALDSGLPVWMGLSARRGEDGRLLSFHPQENLPLKDIIAMIPPSSIDAAGCMHSGAEITGAALGHIRKRFHGPLMAYPDSGFFEMPDWNFHDVISPARLQEFYGEWLEDGAQIIGGCCGLTIEHTRAAVRARDIFQDAL
jgi:methionine synthase I (cobalamin-dependent)